MYSKRILKNVDASTALDAARRLLFRCAVSSSSTRAVGHLQSLSLPDLERLEDLVEDGDFILAANLDATPDWRAKASTALAASGRALIILLYEWGMFSIGCRDSTISMRRSGEDRRLMRQGVGMYVRRHFRTALEKDGWFLGGEGTDIEVRRDGAVGRFRSTQDKFIENGSLKLSQAAKRHVARLTCVFLDEIREDPNRFSVDMHGPKDAVTKTAQILGVAEKDCFACGTVGSSRSFVADGRVLDLMRVMSKLGSDGDLISYRHLRWQLPAFDVDGWLHLELYQGTWTVKITVEESLGMSAPSALAAIVEKFESASSY